MQKVMGNQWAKITKLLPGRTDNAVKNRFHATLRVMKSKKNKSLDIENRYDDIFLNAYHADTFGDLEFDDDDMYQTADLDANGLVVVEAIPIENDDANSDGDLVPINKKLQLFLPPIVEAGKVLTDNMVNSLGNSDVIMGRVIRTPSSPVSIESFDMSVMDEGLEIDLDGLQDWLNNNENDNDMMECDDEFQEEVSLQQQSTNVSPRSVNNNNNSMQVGESKSYYVNPCAWVSSGDSNSIISNTSNNGFNNSNALSQTKPSNWFRGFTNSICSNDKEDTPIIPNSVLTTNNRFFGLQYRS